VYAARANDNDVVQVLASKTIDRDNPRCAVTVRWAVEHLIDWIEARLDALPVTAWGTPEPGALPAVGQRALVERLLG